MKKKVKMFNLEEFARYYTVGNSWDNNHVKPLGNSKPIKGFYRKSSTVNLSSTSLGQAMGR